MHTAILMSFNPPSLANEDQSFPFSSGVYLKASKGLVYFCFFFHPLFSSQRGPELSTILQHFSGNCNAEVSLEKKKKKAQGATAQRVHMAHGPARSPPGLGGSVLICCDVFSSRTLSPFTPRWKKCARTEDEQPGIKHRRGKDAEDETIKKVSSTSLHALFSGGSLRRAAVTSLRCNCY